MTRVLLSNAPRVGGNPWLASWLAAEAAEGFDVRELTRRRALARGTEAPMGAHLQWPEQVLAVDGRWSAMKRLAALLLQCAILRARRRPIVLTAHNLLSHDRRHPGLEAVMWWVVSRLVTDTHLLSAASGTEVLAAHPALRRTTAHVIPHGDFSDLASQAPDRDAARRALSVPDGAEVLLSYGFLRAYKGTTDLMEVFSADDHEDRRLLVAGRCWPGDVAALEGRAAVDPRIDLRIGYAPDEDLLAMIAAADLVVQPFRRVLNSGTVMLALSCRRRVLVPSTPVFDELADRVGEGWVVRYEGALDGAAIAAALSEPPFGEPDLSWCAWPGIQQQIAEMWSVAVPGERVRRHASPRARPRATR